MAIRAIRCTDHQYAVFINQRDAGTASPANPDLNRKVPRCRVPCEDALQEWVCKSHTVQEIAVSRRPSYAPGSHLVRRGGHLSCRSELHFRPGWCHRISHASLENTSKVFSIAATGETIYTQKWFLASFFSIL